MISAYIALRFEWKYAVPVLIALMHDLLITAGVYSLTGREVTTSTVAALLTILGYSLYDTIIVFDRVRENVPRMPRAAFSQIVNRSMSEVLTRSLATDVVHAAAGRRAAALRRRHAQGLRLRAAGRRRVRRLLVDLHRLAGADALEGARARLRAPPRARIKARVRRRRAGLRGGDRRRRAVEAARAGAGRAAEPAGHRARGPNEISKAEFDAIVADLHELGRAAAASRRGLEPATARPRARGAHRQLVDRAAPAERAKPPKPKQKKPRNRRHGRRR